MRVLGEEGDSLYIANRRDFRLLKQSNGQEVVLSVLGQATIGKCRCLPARPRMTTVTALRGQPGACHQPGYLSSNLAPAIHRRGLPSSIRWLFAFKPTQRLLCHPA